MNIKQLFHSLTAVLLLTACSSDLAPEQSPAIAMPDGGEDLVPVEFSVSSGLSLTRAASSIVSFTGGEAVKVCVKPAGASDYTGYDFTTAAAGQTGVGLNAPASGDKPYFPVGASTTVQAYAYYPSTAGDAATFSVSADQTSDAGYKASDLMHAAVRTITKGSSTGTDLQMAHLMAQLHLNVTEVGLTVSSVIVNAKRSATFTPSAGTAVVTGSASDIVAASAAGDAYICIPAQQISGVTVKVVASGSGDEASRTVTYTFTSTDGFVAGSTYSINLAVNAQQLGTTTSIADWNGTSEVTVAPSGDMTIDDIAAVTYNGSAQTPTVVVKKNGATVSSSDYDLNWINNTNAGTAVVVALGKNTHAGSVAVGTFTINPKTLTDAMVGAISAQTYTRSQITPAVTVTDGSALTLNTDYTVIYGENINVASGGSATVTGAGNYTGSVVKNFTINPKDISSMTLTLSQTNATYTGSTITASVSSLMDGDYSLAATTDYTVAGTSVTSATNAAASASAAVTQNTVTVNGTGNYTGSKSGTWSIARATPTLTISTPSNNQLSLTGSSPTGSITVSRSGDGEVTATSSATGVATTSVSGTTVTVTAIADGSATITVKMNQGTNYNAYTASDKTVSVSSTGFIIAPALGDKYYSDGTWGSNPHASGATVIGVVAWLGSDSDLKCGKSHGLVMALADASSSVAWGGYGTDESYLTNVSSIDGCNTYNKNGLTNTTNLGSSHGAANSAATYTPAAPTSNGATSWFLPSAAQWLAVMGSSGIGGYTGTFVWTGYASSSTGVITNINNKLTASGVGGTALTNGATCWSSSEYDDGFAVCVYFNSSKGVYLNSYNKDNINRVRAFLAF